MKSLFGLALVALITPAVAQTDPYASDQKALALAAYMRSRDAVMHDIRDIYFAVGCKVFPGEGNILPLVGNKVRALEAEAQSSSPPLFDPHLNDHVRKAARDGLESANKPGACSFWQNHPGAVAELRREANDAAP